MYGLVLEGGGAKGSYQIGAYKALEEMDIKITGVSGTSIGAINGALIVQGDAKKAYDLWYDIRPSKVFDVNEEYLEKLMKRELTSENLLYLFNKARDILNNRGLDTTLMKTILQENIDEEKLRNSQMDFGFITVSLTDMKPLEIFLEDVPPGKIIDYLMASASLPVFKLEKMNGKLFLDGGFYDNIPINVLLKKGYRDFIVVRTHGLGVVRKVNSKDVNIKYIDPWDEVGTILDFNQETARKNLKLGYYDAQRAFKGLIGREYYLKAKNDEEYYYRYLISLREEDILLAGKILGYENIPYRRMFMEYIIPRLAELLSVDKYKSYEDITVYLVEVLAKDFKVERFRIYSFEEFLVELKKRKPEKTSRHANNIPMFIKRNEMLSKAVKDSIIEEVVFMLFNSELER
ncbi:MAG: patatin [Firmicutes bacterium HGW-Firmicutes-12]|nr:MAG: patatin [Firmicutes bacterium HGW-Firmicutes-12]